MQLLQNIIIHDGKLRKVTLTPNPRFVPKNYNFKTGKKNFQGFEIEALKQRLGPGLEEEISLCPVIALKYYLNKTEELRANTNQLLISIKPGNNEKAVHYSFMGKTDNINSIWMLSTEQLKTMKVSLHEVRALATSTAFYGNTAMTEIMKAARWA